MYSKFIPKNIQEKLKAKERALAYKDTITPDQVKIEGATSPSDIQSRTTFVRMCSNKIEGVPNIVISGGKLNPSDGKQKIGFVPYELTSTYQFTNQGFRPIAGIKDIDVSYKGSWKAIREANINWVVGSLEELDELTPYFLTVGKTVILDWGWVNSNVKNFSQMFEQNEPPFITFNTDNNTYDVNQDIFDNAQAKIQKMGGDYDAIGGKVSNFEMTMRRDGGFDCVTKITALGSSLFSKPIDKPTNEISFTPVPKGEGEDSKLKASNSSDNIINAIINLEHLVKHTVFGWPYNPKEPAKFERSDLVSFTESFIETGKDAVNGIVEIKNGLYDWVAGKVSGNTTEEVAVESVPEPKAEYGLLVDNKKIDADWSEKHLLMNLGKELKSTYVIAVDNKANAQVCWMSAGGMENIFVKWGYMEDQIFNRYLSYEAGEGEDSAIKITFRSIQTKIDDEGNPILNPPEKSPWVGKYKKIATTIRNNKDYLLPINPLKFWSAELLPSLEQLGSLGSYTPLNPLFPGNGDYALPFLTTWKTNPSFTRDQFSLKGSNNKGTLRNIWVNIKEIQKAFGVDVTVSPIKVNSPGKFESGMKALLQQLNNNFFGYWDFELVIDPYDSTNMGVIDKKVNSNKSLTYTTYANDDVVNDIGGHETHKVQDAGIYKFPSFKVGSIVKNQNLSFKIPDSMALTMLYGSNKSDSKTSAHANYNSPDLMKLFNLGKDTDEENNVYKDKYLSDMAEANLGKEDEKIVAQNVGSKNTHPDSKIIKGEGLVITTKEAFNWKEWKGNTASSPEGESDTSRPPKTKFSFLGDTKQIVKLSEAYKEEEVKISDDAVTDVSSGFFEKIATGGDYEQTNDTFPYYIGSKDKSNFMTMQKEIESLIRSRLNGSLNTPGSRRNFKVDTLIPAQLTLEVDGIGGIGPGDIIHTDYIQDIYKANFKKTDEIFGPLTYFQITGLTQKVTADSWTTELVTIMRMNHIPDFQDLSIDLENKDVDVAEQLRPATPVPSADGEDIAGDLTLAELDFDNVEDYDDIDFILPKGPEDPDFPGKTQIPPYSKPFGTLLSPEDPSPFTMPVNGPSTPGNLSIGNTFTLEAKLPMGTRPQYPTKIDEEDIAPDETLEELDFEDPSFWEDWKTPPEKKKPPEIKINRKIKIVEQKAPAILKTKEEITVVKSTYKGTYEQNSLLYQLREDWRPLYKNESGNLTGDDNNNQNELVRDRLDFSVRQDYWDEYIEEPNETGQSEVDANYSFSNYKGLIRSKQSTYWYGLYNDNPDYQ